MIDHLAAAADVLGAVALAVTDPTARDATVIALDGRTLRERAHLLHDTLIVVAARQAPVAGDLRLLMGLVDASHHTTLIANQFKHISEQLSIADLTLVDGAGTGEKLAHMCALARAQVQKAAVIFHTRDVASVPQADRDDDMIDNLNRQIFQMAAQADLPAEERELALRHVLIARCLERIGDNAVGIARQTEFVMTARLRHGDASHQHR